LSPTLFVTSIRRISPLRRYLYKFCSLSNLYTFESEISRQVLVPIQPSYLRIGDYLRFGDSTIFPIRRYLCKFCSLSIPHTFESENTIDIQPSYLHIGEILRFGVTIGFSIRRLPPIRRNFQNFGSYPTTLTSYRRFLSHRKYFMSSHRRLFSESKIFISPHYFRFGEFLRIEDFFFLCVFASEKLPSIRRYVFLFQPSIRRYVFFCNAFFY